MVQDRKSGFRVINHIADWQIEVWAPDLSSLFVQAANGMYALSGLQVTKKQKIKRSFALEYHDTERLLVSFLNELLFYIENEHLGFYDFLLNFTDQSLLVNMMGSKTSSLKKEIKAVTFHNLKIIKDVNGFKVKIVFDV